MFMSIDDLLNGIDSLVIYKKDFDVIKEILNSGDNELFVKILEEVLLGNLCWSDFDKNLSNTEYPNSLRKQLESQKRISDDFEKFVNLRRNIDSNYIYKNGDSNIAFVSQYSDDNVEREFYDEELKKIRSELLYELSCHNSGDTPLVTAFKTRIFNAIRNGEVLLTLSDEDKSKYTIDDSTITDTNTQTVYEYINPDDIFLFINKYFIPVSSEYQTLNDFDYLYMQQNNIDESKMKQIKMISTLLRRDNFIHQMSNNGGVND